MVGIGLISFKPKKVDNNNNNDNDNGEEEKRELVPMTGIDFQIKLMDYSAQVTIRQRFENRESSPIEATYEIVLPRECAVTSFVATVAGQRVSAVVREKEAAKDEYEDGMAAGGSAVLLENDISDDKPDVFRVSVGNLGPQEVATVALTYVTTATANDDGNVEFTLPAAQGKQDIVIAPPRADGKGNNSDNDGNEAERVADGIHLAADIAMGSSIRSVTSPTHKVTFELGASPKEARVTLSEALRGGDDFTLTVTTAEPRVPSARIHRPAAERPQATVMASFFPDLEGACREGSGGDDEGDTGLKEMVFVVDRSGSMSGSKMENAKSTLQLFLRSIPEGTLFNIVCFGSKFSKLFEGGSRALDDETLGLATAHVAGMTANMGGTNLSRPLAAVLAEAPREGVPRLLFVLTDGEVHDREECMRCVREQAKTTRVFTFGIGRDASVALVRGMARAGEGLCELIEDATDMREKVMRQLKRAVRPALTDLSVAWENCGCAVRQAPHILPPLFHGSRLVVYGFAEDADALAAAKGAAVVLRGVLGGTRHFEARVGLEGVAACVGEGPVAQVTKLAAAALIRDLEEGRSYRGKDFAGKDRDSEIVRVSTENGVLSKLTAFVAVTQPRRDAAPAQESMVERPVTIRPYTPPSRFRPGRGPVLFCCNAAPMVGGAAPMMMPRKMRFAPRMMAFGAPMACAAPPPMACAAPMMSKCAAAPMTAACAAPAPMMGGGLKKKGGRAAPKGACDMEVEEECACVAEKASMPVPVTQERIVLEQSANGSWSPEALARLDTAFGDAMGAAPAMGGAAAADTLRRVWSTLVVVAILKHRYAKTEGEWDLLRDKALAWVRKVTKGVDGFDLGAWTKAAEDYVAKK